MRPSFVNFPPEESPSHPQDRALPQSFHFSEFPWFPNWLPGAGIGGQVSKDWVGS